MRTSGQPLLRLLTWWACAVVLVAGCTSSSDAAPRPSEDEATPTGETAVDTPIDQDDALSLAIAESQVACGTLAPWSEGVDLLLWVDEEASTADIEQIKSELRSSELVEGFLFVDQGSVFEEFQDFAVDNPAIRDAIDRSDLPSRFEVRTWEPEANNAAILQRDYQARSIVDDAITKPAACVAPGFDGASLCAEYGLPSPAVVFLQPDATAADIDRLEALLAATNLFDSITFKSQDDARDEFDEVITGFEFDDDVAADILSETQAGDLPASFEFEVVPGTEQETFLEELREDPDIFSVAYFGGGCLPSQ